MVLSLPHSAGLSRFPAELTKGEARSALRLRLFLPRLTRYSALFRDHRAERGLVDDVAPASFFLDHSALASAKAATERTNAIALALVRQRKSPAALYQSTIVLPLWAELPCPPAASAQLTHAGAPGKRYLTIPMNKSQPPGSK